MSGGEQNKKKDELFFVLYTCASDVCVNRRGEAARQWRENMEFALLFNYKDPWEGRRDGKQQQVGGGREGSAFKKSCGARQHFPCIRRTLYIPAHNGRTRTFLRTSSRPAELRLS